MTKFGFDLGRILQHFQNKDFGVITAYKGGRSRKENIEAQAKLKSELKDLGYGYKEIRGVWVNQEGSTEHEYSLFVPKLDKEDAVLLGNEFEQEAVIVTEGDKVKLVFLDGSGITGEESFSKIDIGLKEGWGAWSELRRHKLRYSSVEWHFDLLPKDPVDGWFRAMIHEQFHKDTSIQEYSDDYKKRLGDLS